MGRNFYFSTHHTMCDVLEEMRTAVKVLNFSYMGDHGKY